MQFLRLALLLSFGCALRAFSQPSPASGEGSSTAPVAVSNPLAHFTFDENSVCTNPQYFVDVADSRKFSMRNVPGDGDCMFLAATLAALYSMGLTIDYNNTALLDTLAHQTRATVASVLQSKGRLIIDQDRTASTAAILSTGLQEEEHHVETASDYVQQLKTVGRHGGLYGGGPELTVLSNVWRRPISVYELAPSSLTSFLTKTDDEEAVTTTSQCAIECQGTFGSGVLEDPLPADSAVLAATGGFVGSPLPTFFWHLHILVLDVAPHEKHACVLLPVATA